MIPADKDQSFRRVPSGRTTPDGQKNRDKAIAGRLICPSERRGLQMPTVLRARGFAFYFYAHENQEPPHIHADKGDGTIKLWLDPVRVASSIGLKPAEVRMAVMLAEKHERYLLERWHEFFTD